MLTETVEALLRMARQCDTNQRSQICVAALQGASKLSWLPALVDLGLDEDTRGKVRMSFVYS